jgi:hypothetical protein
LKCHPAAAGRRPARARRYATHRIVTNVYKTSNGQEMKVLEFVSIRK